MIPRASTAFPSVSWQSPRPSLSRPALPFHAPPFPLTWQRRHQPCWPSGVLRGGRGRGGAGPDCTATAASAVRTGLILQGRGCDRRGSRSGGRCGKAQLPGCLLHATRAAAGAQRQAGEGALGGGWLARRLGSLGCCGLFPLGVSGQVGRARALRAAFSPEPVTLSSPHPVLHSLGIQGPGSLT